MNELKEECGIFGIFAHPEAAKMTYLGLFALQHRGQESAGITVSNGQRLFSHKQMGLVADIFDDQTLSNLYGETAIGHVRYSTAGGSRVENAQPLTVTCARGDLAVAHNGNLVNGEALRKELEAEGAIFQTTSDSEVFLHLLARSKKEKLEEALIEILKKVKGAYSLVFLTPNKLIGLRDSYGFRPMCLGRADFSYILASESCALDLVGGVLIREVEPGEMVIIDENGFRSMKITDQTDRRALCIFETIYLARPDSKLFGENMYLVRIEMGRQLAREHPAEADIVIPIPDSGIQAAMGYAKESGIPYHWGLVRNRYVGRTFISPTQAIRELGVQIKLNPIDDVLAGKRVVVVDDSIVRGTTCRKIIKMLRNAGASAVHLRVSSPPIQFPCFYGIDTPARKELLAATHTVEEIRKYMRVDSLGYLSILGLLDSMSKSGSEFCTACFDGNYPVEW
ncbi:MAG: amidophosphoribosyltransferase [bacterium]|nr:amidophosphoribosyltransferase [bacterium]